MKNLLKAAMVALLLTPLVGCGSKGSEKQGSNTAETHGDVYKRQGDDFDLTVIANQVLYC